MCSEVVDVAVTGHLDRFQRKHPWAGFPIAVLYKYFDDYGAYLAALLTYYAFVSLFPLLLLGSTILGFVLAGHPALQSDIITDALNKFPAVTGDLARPRQLGGGPVGLIVGILGSLYGGLGVAQAFQYASNTMWAVPRDSRPNPLHARGRSLILLAVVGLTILATTTLAILGGGGVGLLGTTEKYLAVAVSVVINAATAVFAFRFAPARKLSIRDVLPGAISAAVFWELLQTFGIVYVKHVVNHASESNKVFAFVLGLLAYLFLTAITLLLSVEVNVVLVNHMYPRALLTPFTDDVALTPGDRRAYARQAKAQRSKGFERIDVGFLPRPEPDDQNGQEDGHPPEEPGTGKAG